jgi:hypothetical protein
MSPEIQPRTLRYRTARLAKLGLLGRTRPYRERGSAPHHLCPTRKGEAIAEGEPSPRGGERREPNPLFLAHAAAISELYVALKTGLPEGLRLAGFERERLRSDPAALREHLRRWRHRDWGVGRLGPLAAKALEITLEREEELAEAERQALLALGAMFADPLHLRLAEGEPTADRQIVFDQLAEHQCARQLDEIGELTRRFGKGLALRKGSASTHPARVNMKSARPRGPDPDAKPRRRGSARGR